MEENSRERIANLSGIKLTGPRSIKRKDRVIERRNHLKSGKEVDPVSKLPRDDGARYPLRISMDDSVTSTAASWSDAPDLGEHIAATSVSYKIRALESASNQSRRQTAALNKAELNKRFELLVLPHLDSAYNLARWLLRDEQDAKDVAQEALLRAFRFFDQFRGIDARPWLLKIVRNTSFTWLQQKRAKNAVSLDDDEEDQNQIQGAAASSHAVQSDSTDPEELLLAKVDRQIMNAAIERLPVRFKEALILREFEDLSYKEIAMIAEVPVGTVMSRLGRARALLTKQLQEQLRTKVPR